MLLEHATGDMSTPTHFAEGPSLEGDPMSSGPQRIHPAFTTRTRGSLPALPAATYPRAHPGPPLPVGR